MFWHPIANSAHWMMNATCQGNQIMQAWSGLSDK